VLTTTSWATALFKKLPKFTPPVPLPLITDIPSTNSRLSAIRLP
jgi:hypothetical protein